VFFVILWFASPLYIENLLPPNAAQKIGNYQNSLEKQAAEMITWIKNEDDAGINKKKLYDFYASSIFTFSLSITIMYSLIRRRKKWKPEPVPKPQKGSSILPLLMFYIKRFKTQGFHIIIILLAIALTVQLVLIPINYGCLIKSNHYPRVNIILSSDTEQDNRYLNSSLWLVRENEDNVLIYGSLPIPGKRLPEYKLFTLKKEAIKSIEILDIGSIFKY
jgi:hypothetical protein